jgi:methyl-accepting chemotaxis protein
MTIRMKLNGLPVIGIVAMLASLGVYLAFTSRTRTIEAETRVVEAYRLAAVALRSDVVRLTINPLKKQSSEIDGSYAAFKAAYAGLGRVKALPSISKEFRQMRDSLSGIQDTNVRGVDGLLAAVEEAKKPLVKVFFFEDAINLQKLIVDQGVLALLKPEDAEAARAAVAGLFHAIQLTEYNLTTIVDTVDKGRAPIAKATALAAGQSTITAIVIATFLLLAVLYFANRTARSVVRSIDSIVSNVDLMKEGDLTVVFREAGDRELLRLSRNINLFIAAIGASLSNVKSVSSKSVSAKGRLVDVLTATAREFGHMDASTREVKSGVDTLNGTIVDASSAVGRIVDSIASVNDRQADEYAMVVQSTASVTEIIHSVENVATVTRKKMESADALLEAAKDGGAKLSMTTDIIEDIVKSVDSIRGLTATIQDISERTNLLAMNAAIEASRAGSVGKGFGVIADEIRKLAAGTEANSRQIGSTIKEIVAKIGAASTSSRQTREVFAKIDGEIHEMAHAFSETASNMNELEVGGRQILDAMTRLTAASMEIKAGSGEIDASAANLSTAMERIRAFSQEALAAMNAMAGRIADFDATMKSAQGVTAELGSMTEDLDREVRHFKTAS